MNDFECELYLAKNIKTGKLHYLSNRYKEIKKGKIRIYKNSITMKINKVLENIEWMNREERIYIPVKIKFKSFEVEDLPEELI